MPVPTVPLMNPNEYHLQMNHCHHLLRGKQVGQQEEMERDTRHIRFLITFRLLLRASPWIMRSRGQNKWDLQLQLVKLTLLRAMHQIHTFLRGRERERETSLEYCVGQLPTRFQAHSALNAQTRTNEQMGRRVCLKSVHINLDNRIN